MMVSDIVGSVVLCGVHGAEGREGGAWHGADPLPCWWAPQFSPHQCTYWADTGGAGQSHELQAVVSGRGEGAG